MSDRARQRAYGVALAALCVVSRVPQVLGPHLLVDGDEAFLGLMAKHVLQGRAFPVFFYGQHYGFSSVEAVAGAIGFALFGTGAVPLKLAMLGLWTVGVVFLFLALSRIAGVRRSFWLTAVFVLSPAWAVWSMKARGGYLTSFVAASVLLWLLTDSRPRSEPRWMAAGALTAVVYLAQPLWLPGVLPFVVAALMSDRRWSWTATYVSVSATPILFLRIASVTAADVWGGPAAGNEALIGSVPAVLRQIYVNLTGAYYLAWAVEPPGVATRVLAVLWCGVLAATLVVHTYRVIARRGHRWSQLFFLSMCATIVASWVLLPTRDARYLLPLSAPLVVVAGLEVLELVDRRVLPKSMALSLAGAVLVTGALSMREFRGFAYLWPNPPGSMTEAGRLRQLLGYLKARGVGHVFSMNGLLSPQLIFYSDETILSRSSDLIDRYPPYVDAVNRALADGKPVAVVGYTDESGAPGCWDVPICTGGIAGLVPDPAAIVTVDRKYFAYVGANRDLLRRLRFQLPD